MDVASQVWTHLRVELGRLDHYFRRAIDTARRLNPQHGADEYRGLYVSDHDVDALLQTSSEPHDGGDDDPSALVRQADTDVAARRHAAPDHPFVRLGTRLGLTPFEHDALLVCLGPEIDLRYERLFGYLQDDVTKRHPTPDLILSLFCPTPAARLEARSAFHRTAPLLAFRTLYEDPGARHQPLLARSLKVDDGLVEYLLGRAEIDARLAGAVQVLPPGRSSWLSPALDEANLRRLAQDAQRDHGVTLLVGGDHEQRKAIAEMVGLQWERPLLRIDVPALARLDLPPDVGVTLAWRQAVILDAVPFWDEVDTWLEEGGDAWRAALVQILESRPSLALMASRIPWEPLSRPLLRLDVPDLTFADRKLLWIRMLGDAITPEAAGEVAGKFRLSAGQIQKAARTTRGLAQSAGRPPVRTDVLVAAREHSNQHLARLARKISPLYTWSDIVLPPERMRLLAEICQHIGHSHIVYEEWGFDHQRSLGKGLNALFAGQSGTGKTMAAEIVAIEAALDLYKINLATVVSKYIGETEKNLDRIFSEAQGSNAILFFDEADAIFGKRSEVRDSHDRYANIEIAYLLQKMEEYEGVTILATNLRKNIDEAFVRRMHFTLEFPMPEEEDRLRIWRKAFPSQAPLAADVDLQFLARQFRLSGGNIKNVALAAAFLAVEDGTAICMRHIIWGTRREFQKMGRLITAGDFGPYFGYAERVYAESPA